MARGGVLKNDYNQHFIDTGERPQNFIRDADVTVRFSEYPKVERLIQLKDEANKSRAHPPQHIKADLRSFDISSLESKFDVILVDPPWTEYRTRIAGAYTTEDLEPWTIDDISSLKVDQVAETPSFCFLWAGSDHLDDARTVLSRWGFRRCEDICWCKTNKRASARRRVEARGASPVIHDTSTLFQRTKEHCLVGLKGTLRRSVDTHLIHSNIDTDVILDDEPEEVGSTAKPIELYDIIERFCLGRRKLELFANDRNIRRGWLSVGRGIGVSNFNLEEYKWWFAEASAAGWPEIRSHVGGRYVGSSPEIEQLRPKSPPRSIGPRTASERGSSESGERSSRNLQDPMGGR